MKLNSMFGILLFVMSSSALANLATDQINGPVTCSLGNTVAGVFSPTGPTVTINQARTSFSVLSTDGDVVDMNVVRKRADSTGITYVGVGTASTAQVAILEFDNGGDQIYFRSGDRYDLANCHERTN